MFYNNNVHVYRWCALCIYSRGTSLILSLASQPVFFQAPTSALEKYRLARETTIFCAYPYILLAAMHPTHKVLYHYKVTKMNPSQHARKVSPKYDTCIPNYNMEHWVYISKI